MRKLASIRRISDIQPIQGADAIEVAVVDGWKVVVKKNEYKAGDLAVYMEIDSWIPHDLAPFLSKGQEPREYNGILGERLRTVKLRGQISQGLLMDLGILCETGQKVDENAIIVGGDLKGPIHVRVGEDVTDALKIQKWEAPIPAQLAGQVRGVFPTHLIPKTDQERIQNCFPDIQAKGDVTYEVTLKLDGTSCTIFRFENELRVCSRNLELKVNDENKHNTLVNTALQMEANLPEGLAFQGELMGEGIQGNREGFKGQRFFVFDIFDIKEHKYLEPEARRRLCNELGFEHVPVIHEHFPAPESVEHGLSIAEGPSINHKIREGLVWKCNADPNFSFKTINNTFLLKGGD